jgi:phosphoglucomutase
MTDFRNNPPKDLGGSRIILSKDFQKLEARDANGNVSKLEMPDTSNVLQWFCDDGTKVSVRPSGTEPKIKFYTEVKDASFKGAEDYERCTQNAEVKIAALKKTLKLD